MAVTDQGTVPMQPADDEKDRIGRAAAALVSAGETVFLGPGKTTLAVARHLTGHPNLTVIGDPSRLATVKLGNILLDCGICRQH